MKKTNDFGRDSVPLLVLKTSVPFMLAQLVNVLYSIVDRIYVGNIPVIGADSLAGAGVCAPIITLKKENIQNFKTKNLKPQIQFMI